MKLAFGIVTVMVLAANAAAEPALSGNVLVWVDAPMYLDADAAGPSIKLGALDRGRELDVGFVVPMHVLAVRGELVEVEPASDIECVWWRMIRPDALASLHLYVKTADLAPVVAKPFTASFKDGSKISLQPGVPVLDGKVAFLEGIVPAAVPEGSRGLAYTPHAITPVPPRGKHTFLLDENTGVSLGADSFELGPWVASAAQRAGKRMLVSIATRCMTAVISAPKEHVHADVALGKSFAPSSEAGHPGRKLGADRYYLAQGTPLTSATGDHVVATLAAEQDVQKPTGARACAEFVVKRDEPMPDAPHTRDAAQPARTLKLCAAATAVKVERR